MKLSAPKVITWWIALIIGVVGVVLHLFLPALVAVPFGLGFWLVVVAFVLLVVATAMKGLWDHVESDPPLPAYDALSPLVQMARVDSIGVVPGKHVICVDLMLARSGAVLSKGCARAGWSPHAVRLRQCRAVQRPRHRRRRLGRGAR
jgi:hypothetical protein